MSYEEGFNGVRDFVIIVDNVLYYHKRPVGVGEEFGFDAREVVDGFDDKKVVSGS